MAGEAFTNQREATLGQTVWHRRHARQLCALGRELLDGGHLSDAIETFDESLSVCATAEAFTFRGWARSRQGRLQHAISDCKRAIRIDPDLGNPYNDLGVYLVALGRMDEAFGWFAAAKETRRYRSRHFPFLNLGHLFMLEGKEGKALVEYVHALELDPGNQIAREGIAALEMACFTW